jgi:hypothetical protein
MEKAKEEVGQDSTATMTSLLTATRHGGGSRRSRSTISAGLSTHLLFATLFFHVFFFNSKLMMVPLRLYRSTNYHNDANSSNTI